MMTAILISLPSHHERWLAEDDAIEARNEAACRVALDTVAVALARVGDDQQDAALFSILGDCLARLNERSAFASRLDALAEVDGILAVLPRAPSIIERSVFGE